MVSVRSRNTIIRGKQAQGASTSGEMETRLLQLHRLNISDTNLWYRVTCERSKKPLAYSAYNTVAWKPRMKTPPNATKLKPPGILLRSDPTF